MDDELDFLALFRHEDRTLVLKPGQILFRKGDPARDMFVVKAGELVIGEGNVVFETVRPGGMVGEMALVDREPRSATVRAGSAECELIPIDERRFLMMIQQTPFFAVRIMKLISLRLRAMNERLTQL